MAQGNGDNQGTLVNVKRVRRGEQDNSGRDKIVLTFGTDQDGNNGLDTFLTALEGLRGKQANVDIRISTKEGRNGTFDTAFVIVKEMIPKGAGGAPGAGKTYVPKDQASAAKAQAAADRARKAME